MRYGRAKLVQYFHSNWFGPFVSLGCEGQFGKCNQTSEEFVSFSKAFPANVMCQVMLQKLQMKTTESTVGIQLNAAQIILNHSLKWHSNCAQN